MKRNEIGITLIALVITIIVLLILAGVSIATLTGDNGILSRASEAKEKTQIASEDELRRLTALEASTNLENQLYTDENKDTVTIPAGFAVSQVEGEKTVDDGLVVIDSNENEFVWIPVEDINDMAQCSTAGEDCSLILQNGQVVCETHDNNTNIVGKLYATATGETFDSDTPNTSYEENVGVREPDTVSTCDNTPEYLNIIKGILIENVADYTDITAFKTTMQEDYNAMIKSVKEYGGFYIGRYEISKSNINTAQSKKNTVALTAAEDSANKWYGLYAYGKTYTNTTDSVVSSMIWGSQYDAMMTWMQSGENAINVTMINDDVKNMNQTLTGPENDRDIIKNVYDLYGGRREWTLEALYAGARVYRGGGYYRSISPSARGNYDSNSTDTDISSHFTLYIK